MFQLIRSMLVTSIALFFFVVSPGIWAAGWAIVDVPSPGEGGSFQDLVAISDNDIWAVGHFKDPATTGKAGNVSFAMHFDGGSWQIHELPQFGYSNDELYAVAAVGPDDVWVGGAYDDNLRRRFPLLLHWDGRRWRQYDAEGAGGTILDMQAVSGDLVWAVGEGSGGGAPGALINNLILRWDGSRWEAMPVEQPANRSHRLTGVAASGPNDAWAVGYFRNIGSTFTSMVFHWDGNAWTAMDHPNPPYQTFLYAVTAISPTEAWAFGAHDTGDARLTTALHWDGSSWQLTYLEEGGTDGTLFSADNAGPDAVWATGYMVQHWDGGTWTQEYVEGLAPFANLRGVSVVSPDSVWAAGSASDRPYLLAHRTADTPPGNAPPVAQVSAEPAFGTSPLTVQFTGDASYDPDGVIVSYFWDFGDGSTSTEANPAHTYINDDPNLRATFYPSLTVTDDEGATDTASAMVNVDPSQPPPANQNPVAVASATPSTGSAPLTVSFDASGSYDPDGSIVSYHWAFGDGTASTEPNPVHVYTAAGEYSPILTVTDNSGAVGFTFLTINVTADSGGNSLFVASQQVTEIQVGRRRWAAEDRIVIHDSSGQPVSGAMVVARYNGPTFGMVSGTTGADGSVTLTTRAKRSRRAPKKPWCFEVTGVSKSGMMYNPQLNVVTRQCEN